jgi:hypothetical protein
LRLSAIFLFALCALTSVASADVEWVRARGSCADACARAGLKPVVTGLYDNGQPFFLCASDIASEGSRAGYNLEPDWSDACWVGYGGKEVASRPFKCLCQNHRIIPPTR